MPTRKVRRLRLVLRAQRHCTVTAQGWLLPRSLVLSKLQSELRGCGGLRRRVPRRLSFAAEHGYQPTLPETSKSHPEVYSKFVRYVFLREVVRQAEKGGPDAYPVLWE